MRGWGLVFQLVWERWRGPQFQEGVQRLGDNRNYRHPSCFVMFPCVWKAFPRRQGPLWSSSPLCPQNLLQCLVLAGPPIGWIGGGWR